MVTFYVRKCVWKINNKLNNIKKQCDPWRLTKAPGRRSDSTKPLDISVLAWRTCVKSIALIYSQKRGILTNNVFSRREKSKSENRTMLYNALLLMILPDPPMRVLSLQIINHTLPTFKVLLLKIDRNSLKLHLIPFLTLVLHLLQIGNPGLE